jgi:hypothetical protein
MIGRSQKKSGLCGAVLPVLGLWLSGVIVSAAAPQPVLYYDFEEQSGGTVQNLGTLGGSGTLINAPAWVTGTPGAEDGGLLFNGLGYNSGNATYIDTGITAGAMGVHAAGVFRPFTMAAWVQGGKPEIEGTSYNDEFIFGQIAGDFVLHLGIRDQRAHFGNWGDDVTASGFVMQTGVWYHVVWQLDESNVQWIFVNGVQRARRQSTGPGIKQDLNIVIGTSTTGSRTLQGPADDTAIYTNVLSLSQIQFLAAGGSPTNLPERVSTDDGLFYTAPTGVNNTWNLYQVIGYHGIPQPTWWEAYLLSTNMLYEGEQGHLVTIGSRTENEFCRYLRDLYGVDCWIGLTDNDTNEWNAVLFPGAYESGNATNVTDLATRRNNGWVWVNGEPYGAATFQNWGGTEPNDNPSEDAVVLVGGGTWNDIGSGIPGSGDDGPVRIAIVEWDLNSPVPVPGAIVRDAILPDSAELPAGDVKADGSFVGVWVRDAGNVDNIRVAVNRIVAGAGTVIVTNKGISVINACDPDAGSPDSILFPNNRPYFANIPGVAENHWSAYYRGRIVIPPGEGGLYTFGVHSDDGFALRIPGRSWSSVHGLGWLDYGDTDLETITFEYGTGDSNTRGIINLPAGAHDIEFFTYNGTGGQHHELYAAKGAFPNDADTTSWRLVGHKSVGNIVFAGVSLDEWTVWHSGNESVSNLSNAWAAVSGYMAIPSNQSAWAEINFWDPQSGQQGQLPNSVPFPWDTPADDNNKALFGVATLVIPADTTIGLGFQGDDGSRLTVSNQTWNTPLLEAVNVNSVIAGDSIEHNVGTGNSRTVGSITLPAGSYPLSILYWEGGGGSYLDVFQRNPLIYEAQLPSSIPQYRPLSTTSAEVIQDIDGLQLKRLETMLIILY